MPMSPEEPHPRQREGWPDPAVHNPDEPGPEQIRHDEEQTERQAPPDANPGEASGG